MSYRIKWEGRFSSRAIFNTFDEARLVALDWTEQYITDEGHPPSEPPSIWARVGAVQPPDEAGDYDIEVEEDVVREMARVAGLSNIRSRGAEAALAKAIKILDDPDVSIDVIRATHRELHDTLGDTDPFWARWTWYAEKEGIEP